MKNIKEYLILEMNDNKLPSDIKVEDKDGTLTISFGKNGWGLTDELIKIGEIVYKISQKNNIYIENVLIDAMDDVYTFTFTYDNKDFNL